MFKAHFDLRLSANHATLRSCDGGEPLEARPTRPFSYGGKLVADREALTDLLRSMVKQAGPRGLRRFAAVATIDVEVAELIGEQKVEGAWVT